MGALFRSKGRIRMNDLGGGSGMTRYAVETVELPAAVHAVAAQNPDGTYVIFTNVLCSENVRQDSIRELVRRIGLEGER